LLAAALLRSGLMRWDEGHESPDVIDRRGQGPDRGGGISGVLALAPLLARHPIGLVILLLLLVGSALLGTIGTRDSDAPRATETAGTETTADDRDKHFVSFVLDDTQKNWRELFAKRGWDYRNAKLVLFDGATSTACGYGESATGPFYCPLDERVYIDLSFYDDLGRRFGAKGDFAQAYVIAHEIGHHVQNQLGSSKAVHGLRRSQREGETGANVRLELQADCYAGIWARSTDTRGLLEQGDIDEALTAAAAIGDDRLQKQAGRAVTPETFTHGTSAQRARWFRIGYQTGDIDACDTFKASKL
jgi:predicted metalloprotease